MYYQTRPQHRLWSSPCLLGFWATISLIIFVYVTLEFNRTSSSTFLVKTETENILGTLEFPSIMICPTYIPAALQKHMNSTYSAVHVREPVAMNTLDEKTQMGFAFCPQVNFFSNLKNHHENTTCAIFTTPELRMDQKNATSCDPKAEKSYYFPAEQANRRMFGKIPKSGKLAWSASGTADSIYVNIETESSETQHGEHLPLQVLFFSDPLKDSLVRPPKNYEEYKSIFSLMHPTAYSIEANGGLWNMAMEKLRRMTPAIPVDTFGVVMGDSDCNQVAYESTLTKLTGGNSKNNTATGIVFSYLDLAEHAECQKATFSGMDALSAVGGFIALISFIVYVRFQN